MKLINVQNEPSMVCSVCPTPPGRKVNKNTALNPMAGRGIWIVLVCWICPRAGRSGRGSGVFFRNNVHEPFQKLLVSLVWIP